jgi:hypothetical protein
MVEMLARCIPTPPLWWLVWPSGAEALLPRQVVASVPASREFNWRTESSEESVGAGRCPGYAPARIDLADYRA